MPIWQRRARLVLGVFVVAFGVVVYFAIGRRPPEPVESPVIREDPAATSEVRGGAFVQIKGDRPEFRLFHDKVLTYPDGRNKITGVRLEIDQREGRNFVIRAAEGEVAPNQTDFTLRGNVDLVSNDGLTVRTNEASYSQGEGILRAPGAVEFSKGRLSGTAVGMTYDERRDVLWLLDQAVVHMAAEGDQPAAEITAGAAGWARHDRYLRFERSVHTVRGGRGLDADVATAYLSEDEQRLETIELRGSSRVSGAAAGGPGALEAMRARDVNLVYAGDADNLSQATLAGDASIVLTGAEGAPGRRLAADWIDLGFAEDGATVNRLTAHTGVELDLPAETGQPARAVRAGSVVGTGSPGQGINSVRFEGGEGVVEFTEGRPGRDGSRTARAERLELRVEPGLGAVHEAVFRGNTRFTDGSLEAQSRDARYAVRAAVIDLEGDSDGRPPRVRDEQATIEAARLRVALEPERITAAGGVRSVLSPIPGPAAGASAQTRRPGILEGDRPANATADALEYDSGTGRVAYRGHARLWQLDTAIQADEIVIDDRKGDLQAAGNVRTTMRMAEPAKAAGAAVGGKPAGAGLAVAEEAAISVATAAALLYEDAARRMTYTTGAHMVGPQGDLTADKIELYLAREGGTLEHAEAYGHVAVRPTGRTATGDRLSYFAADERYLMTGAPVRIVEECRETQGKTLTFFRSTDRIVVDGNEESRTQTKGGAKCGEPRFD